MIKALLALTVLLAAARQAHAVSACDNNIGFAPKTGTVVPKHARLLAYDDDTDDNEKEYTATIDTKTVPLKVTKIASAPYVMQVLEVDSDKTGTLVVFQKAGKSQWEVGRYTIKGDVKMPAEVKGSKKHMTKDIHHTTVREKYDTLSINVDPQAILATIKIRRDAQADWTTMQTPVTPPDFMDDKPAIRIGKLGCVENYSVGLLKNGVEIDLVVTLVDGSTRPVTLPKPVKL